MQADFNQQNLPGDSIGVTVDFKWNKAEIAKYRQNFNKGVIDMAYTILGGGHGILGAKERAPYVTGALRNSIRVDRSMLESDGLVEIIAGGTTDGNIKRNVNYAAKREIGPNRNPATEHYMANTLTAVMGSDWQQIFFGEITK